MRVDLTSCAKLPISMFALLMLVAVSSVRAETAANAPMGKTAVAPVVKVPCADAKTEKEMKPYTEIIVGSEAKFDLVPIPGGKFMMGSPEDEPGHKADEGPQHEVAIEPFWMGKHEVRWDAFEEYTMKMNAHRRN